MSQLLVELDGKKTHDIKFINISDRSEETNIFIMKFFAFVTVLKILSNELNPPCSHLCEK